jgi:nucleoside-diphosphate-sugar epimerase
VTGDRPVLVTGARGLVGRAVCAHLTGLGTPVVAVAHRPTGDLAGPPGLALDLTADSLLHALGGQRLSSVVHCAALVPTNPAYPDSPTSAAGNRAIDENVYEAAAADGTRVVYVSSCGLYDPRQAQSKTEGAPVAARTPYFEAKLAGEQLFSRLEGSVVMRLSGPVGPGMRANLVLPRFLATALAGGSLTLWGSGAREQDFVDVADVARFVGLALQHAGSGIFNVASGVPVTMRALAETVVGVAGSGSVELADQPDPMEGDTARYSVDRAREQLGWSPQVGLETMVRRLLAGRRPGR